MGHREFHVMTAVLVRERRTMRYTCTSCARCMEDGPEGLTLVHAGDRVARHRAGSLTPAVVEVEQAPPSAPRVLH